MLITDWIRAAVSGSTVDGREIEAGHIEQMAASYKPDVYQAKVWLEHLRGVVPDNVFKSLGDVVAVKSEVIKKGDLAGKVALFVKLAPSTELIRLVRSGQKTHLSVEIQPEFPATEGAYLVGLGVTDSPASVGTGIMSFNVGKRKESLFSSPVVCDLTDDFEGENLEKSDLAEVKQILKKLTSKSGKKNNKKYVKASKFNQLQGNFTKLKNAFDEYMNEEEEQPNRPEITGGSGEKDIWKH